MQTIDHQIRVRITVIMQIVRPQQHACGHQAALHHPDTGQQWKISNPEDEETQVTRQEYQNSSQIWVANPASNCTNPDTHRRGDFHQGSGNKSVKNRIAETTAPTRVSVTFQTTSTSRSTTYSNHQNKHTRLSNDLEGYSRTSHLIMIMQQQMTDIQAPNDTAYTLWSSHSGLLNPVQIVSSAEMRAWFTFFVQADHADLLMAGTAPHKSGWCRD